MCIRRAVSAKLAVSATFAKIRMACQRSMSLLPRPQRPGHRGLDEYSCSSMRTAKPSHHGERHAGPGRLAFAGDRGIGVRRRSVASELYGEALDLAADLGGDA